MRDKGLKSSKVWPLSSASFLPNVEADAQMDPGNGGVLCAVGRGTQNPLPGEPNGSESSMRRWRRALAAEGTACVQREGHSIME